MDYNKLSKVLDSVDNSSLGLYTVTGRVYGENEILVGGYDVPQYETDYWVSYFTLSNIVAESPKQIKDFILSTEFSGIPEKMQNSPEGVSDIHIDEITLVRTLSPNEVDALLKKYNVSNIEDLITQSIYDADVEEEVEDR